MAKELDELSWIEELLPHETSRRKMFGGFAYYLDEKLILFLIESLGNRTYRDNEYDFEIWNGVMFPAEKEHHAEILQAYPFLRNHPILPKWLYLPLGSEDFESDVEAVLRELRRRNPKFGSLPKPRSSKGKGRVRRGRASEGARAHQEDRDERIDTRTPRMFSDEPAEERLQKVRRLSDFKNIGPEIEKIFLRAGIKTPAQFQKLGWKKTMIQLCKCDPKYNHSMFAYTVIGALENKFWGRISEDAKNEAREFMKSLRDEDKRRVARADSSVRREGTPVKASARKAKLPGAKVRKGKAGKKKLREAKVTKGRAGSKKLLELKPKKSKSKSASSARAKPQRKLR